MLPSRFSILTALVVLLAVAAVARLDAFWAPHSDSDFSSFWNQFQYTADGTSIDSQPWVQQMRNFKDILRVQAFRPKPTPTPTPTPKPTPTPTPDPSDSAIINWAPGPATFTDTSSATYTQSFGSYDRHPLHPLRNYFSDVSGIYGVHGYSHLQSLLHGAGRIIENLNNPKDATRFREARKLARKLESAVALSTDFQVFDHYTYFGPYDGSTPHIWDDYRGIALTLAQNLNLAAKNASRHRPLDRGLPYIPFDRTLTITPVIRSQNGQELFTITKTDGYGKSNISNLLASSYVSSTSDGGTSATSNSTNTGSFGSSSFASTYLATGSGTFTLVGFDSPTPTPTPSPTP